MQPIPAPPKLPIVVHIPLRGLTQDCRKNNLVESIIADTAGMPIQKSEFLSETWKDGIFNDKVVFCTGGSGSICSAQVRALVYLGANACIVGRNAEKAESMAKDIATARKGAKVLGIGNVDVRKYESLEAAVERCVKELGGLDFCIAGAAGNFLASMNALSPNAFKSVIDIDVLGSYHTLKACMPYLVKSAAAHKNTGKALPNGTGGRIIFVSATLHYTGATPLQTHVSAAKAAVDALCYATAIEQGPLGVTSNIIAPGPIAGTEGMDRLSQEGSRERSMRAVPLGRYGFVKEIADATVYLFSDAGNFVNGAALVVDGGSWRVNSTLSEGSPFKYPDFFLENGEVSGVKGMKKSKI